MSERKSRGNILGGGRWIIALVTVSAMVLVLAGSSRAQAQSTGSKSGQASAPPSAKSAAAPKGHSEGITVHGHWTIEVRNPDGKLVKHVEFENALNAPTGGPLLMALITGQNSPGAWTVGLEPTGSSSIGGVCKNQSQIAVGLTPTSTADFAACVLAESGDQYFATCSDSIGCFPTLSVTPPTTTGQGVTLTGTMTAESPGTIGGVITTLMTCSSVVTPNACPTSPTSPATIGMFPPGITQLAPSASAASLALDFEFGIALTYATLGTPVTVATGQSVAATVVLSFM